MFLPEWLLAGLGITGVLAVVFAVVFAVGERLYPTAPVETDAANSGEWKRRREIRAYLRAIDEQYAEDHFVGGQHVAFYLPSRDVAITFDAQAYFRIEKTGTYAILAEHEMPGWHLGARLPFETPAFDGSEAAEGGSRDSDAGPDPVEAAFATLGLGPDATAAQVRSAYRERVKEVHPDHGGDEERFRRLREAYTTARNRAS